MSFVDEPEEMDAVVEYARFAEKLENLTSQQYAALAEKFPEVDEFARDVSEQMLPGLREIMGEDYDRYNQRVGVGFYRIFMNFTTIGETDEESDTISMETMSAVLLDIAGLLEGDWPNIAFEWSVLAVTMAALGVSEGVPTFTNADTRFAYLYALVKTMGSATGKIGPADDD